MKYAVAVIVLALAAIAYPNIVESKHRSAQKRTMADIRTIATAWEARATDINSYLVGRPGSVAYDDLRRVLEPKYVRRLPRVDGWGHPYFFATGGQEYQVRSNGADGRADGARRGATTNFDCDILYSNGTFVEYPEGTCQE